MKPLKIRKIRKQCVTKEGIPFLSLAMKIMWLYRTNRREENCDTESSGGCADDSEDSIPDDEGLADNSVLQIQTDIQDNMNELWHWVAENSKLSVQVQTQSTSSWDVNSNTCLLYTSDAADES